MFSRRTWPVWIGLIFFSGMFVMGQDTWGPGPECVVDADCDDGNVCTDDACVNAVCVNLCNATGPEDPCCADAACLATPVCAESVQRDLPDTGITRCYDMSSEIECPAPGEPFYGQDAHYTANPMSYTDSGNETVTDNVTGLMWQQCSAGLSGEECSTGTATAMNWDHAVAHCESLVLGAHTDWRVPDKYELQSMVHYGQEGPAIDTAAFPGTRSSPYWSSTLAAGADHAWFVDFNSGHVRSHDNTNTNYVRCVRGDWTPPQSFTDNGNGTVTDSVTGLLWQRQDDGIRRNWDAALAYCQDLELGGVVDWRLPDIRELASIGAAEFPGTRSTGYWSSSTYTSLIGSAWGVNFLNGFVGIYLKTPPYIPKQPTPGYVRCVR